MLVHCQSSHPGAHLNWVCQVLSSLWCMATTPKQAWDCVSKFCQQETKGPEHRISKGTSKPSSAISSFPHNCNDDQGASQQVCYKHCRTSFFLTLFCASACTQKCANLLLQLKSSKLQPVTALAISPLPLQTCRFPTPLYRQALHFL